MVQERKRCEQCGFIAKPRATAVSCPRCGFQMTTEQHFDIKVELHTSFPMFMDVSNAPGPKDKAPTRVIIKNELHHDTGRWQQTHRTYDRQNDRYRKTIIDFASGEVVSQTDEELSEHRGHGSAKRKAVSDHVARSAADSSGSGPFE